MAAGEMREAQFEAFLLEAFLMMVEFSVNGSLHYAFSDWKHTLEFGQAGRRAFTELKNICVWDKTVGSRGFYRSRHELIYVFKSGKARHIDNIGIGKGKRYRTNVWTYKGMNTGGPERLQALQEHPTQKPARMLADAILDCTQPGGIVLDPFGGSGSTMIAAEMVGRRARLIEIDPHYCDTSIRRWQSYAKADAVHAITGETFNACAERLVRERSAPVAEVL
jgi:DNA modification methylase